MPVHNRVKILAWMFNHHNWSKLLSSSELFFISYHSINVNLCVSYDLVNRQRYTIFLREQEDVKSELFP